MSEFYFSYPIDTSGWDKIAGMSLSSCDKSIYEKWTQPFAFTSPFGFLFFFCRGKMWRPERMIFSFWRSEGRTGKWFICKTCCVNLKINCTAVILKEFYKLNFFFFSIPKFLLENLIMIWQHVQCLILSLSVTSFVFELCKIKEGERV